VLWRHILDRLVADNPIEVPEMLVHEQMLQLYAQQVHLEQGRTLTEGELQIDPDTLREPYGEPALHAVRGQVILHHLEETLGLAVSPDEVDAEVAALASGRAQNPEALKRSLEQRGYLDTLRAQLAERKVFQALMDSMVITDTFVSEDELAPDDIEAATALPEEG
jgi:FKBP-type peptidyl-prolyl cis-trans isomerase (trigger factor)